MRGSQEFFFDETPDLSKNNDLVIFSEKMRYITPQVARLFWGIGGIVVLLGFALFQITSVLYLIVTGFVVSLALERFIQFRQHCGCSRGFALGLAYLFLILFMLSGMIIMIPFVTTQLIGLLQMTFSAIQEFQTQIQNQGLLTVIEGSFLPDIIKERLADQMLNGGWIVLVQTVILDNISQIVTVSGESLKSAGSLAFNLVDGVLNTLAQVTLIMTVAVFFSIERIPVFTFLAKLTNKPENTFKTLQHLSLKLGLWLEGQLLLCLIIGLCVGVGLWIVSWIGFDLPNKFSLALIAGLTEFLPFIGPILGSIPALLVALIAFGRKGFLVTLVLYRAVQVAENNLIVPAVMSSKLGVSPLVIFLCMLLGFSLFGFLGVLLCVPLAIVASIFVKKALDDKE